MVVIDKDKWACPKDNIRPLPVFLYAKHSTVGDYGHLSGKQEISGYLLNPCQIKCAISVAKILFQPANRNNLCYVVNFI